MGNHLKIRKVAVLGAGVMGAQIAAHLVNANVETLLFELPAKEGDPNGNVNKALAGLKKLEPAPISSPSRISYIEAANYEQHLDKLRECDLIIEAIAERIDWKSDLYRKVAPFVNARAIFATNTSGLSINTLAEAFPEALRHRFCGIHFFNPPRYMHLVELIPCKGTEAALLDQLETFLVSTLGKGVVRAKDTPNFIANRIGVFSMLATKHHAAAFNLGFDMVDALTGRYLGRPKSATFRTLDVVGLDVFAHVVNTMRENLTEDPWHKHFELPGWFQYLVDQGSLGQKSKRGIYQKIGKEIHVLDLHTREYKLSDAKVDDGVKDILRERDWAKKLAGLRNSQHPQAQFLWSVFRDVFHYCALHLEAIADNARDLDFAVRWGFGWDNGPFEIWQAAGWTQVTGWIAEDIAAGKAMADKPLPVWVADPTRSGVHTAHGSYAPATRAMVPRSALSVYLRQPYPDHLLGEVRQYGETVFETDEVRLWHTGDSIAILSFKTKMHTVSNEVLDGILRAVEEAEAHFSALILWQSEPPFSAGANLLQLMQGVQETPDTGLFGKLKGAVNRVKYTAAGGGGVGDILNAATGNVPKVETVVAKFQQTSMRLKYAQIPTIAAVDGLALGGGCEFSIHCSRIVATLESYIGLVEVGVGLLPAGGGCKEMAQRASQEAQRYSSDNRVDIFPFVRRYFQHIAMGEVAKSAELARDMGYLRPSDRIVMNKFELLHIAKEEAKALNATAYRPPLHQRQIMVAGRTGTATLKAAMVNMLAGGFISEHDYDIGCRVADTLCGGDVEAGSLVDEQWLLDLEIKHFMELLATDKTQARIEHMLKSGKPLRN
ncbi:MAG: 3-hydroxyacyl-CoA dehydrogenase/enoyl-CoA hydratase family protein [Gammaproteobacteria bacterium]|nr:3-hydroxyacyl-CoA dehydrogenase/enoyl-CoA hydratase family protein [Sideroxydans sp.]MBU3903816.1 3-hydroxyacyl-CoA dehydrogenase/enoyl-CoA hydratase family protein [Gammaproteobacteria bacterium]MBU4044981.1 3-hydroxyacyl-CoA dehydrogenase/enoyl-CoA hydratase family protein [Gammaproteobacteria bacterium]MBU4150758.1 3-hydroxyacyl-CoA dehydrogenase/enoyl-CoA hydratase family protein [Gammaproteobacteria bacterium]